MGRRKPVAARVLALAATLLVVSCTPAAGPAPSTGPTRGGTLTLALWQEPTSLSPLNLSSSVAAVVTAVALEPLARTDDDGNYVPVLAARVPTLQNGGVRLGSDGRSMDVTWELRPGLRWSDGEPVTSADIKFTWEARLRQKNVAPGSFAQIASIDLPDDRTAVLHYPALYAPYALTFATSGTANTGSLLPKHLLENVSDIAASGYARLPIGTGPFKLTDWSPKASVTAERNPYYWRPGRPYLDRIVFRFVESREKAVAQLVAGEVDGVWNVSEPQAADIARYPSLRQLVAPSPNIERIEFNFAQNKDMADPAIPHPVLGDIAMRRALLLATPKQEIIDKLLYGKAAVGRAALQRGWAAVKDLAQESNDPDKARDILDKAGWSPGADGIRRRSGIRASLTLTSVQGDELRAQEEEILVDSYRKIGVELSVQNVPIGTLFPAGGTVARGSYDMFLISTNLGGVDPGLVLSYAYRSSGIPSATDPGSACPFCNYTRFSSAEVDRAIAMSNGTLDPEARKAAYAKILRALNDAVVAIWLYERSTIDAYRSGVYGWDQPVFGYLGWNSDEWYITPTSPPRSASSPPATR